MCSKGRISISKKEAQTLTAYDSNDYQWVNHGRADSCLWQARKRLASKARISAGNTVGRFIKDK